MARSGVETKNRILTTAYGLFYREGFARVGVDAIAESTGITKRTLYNHFESKDALLAAVLDRQHRYAFDQIQRWGNVDARTPADFLVSLFESLEQWASRPRWLGSGFTRLTMELADLPGHPARSAATKHKMAVEDWLAVKLGSLDAPHPRELSRQVMLLIEGCHALILIHGDKTYASTAGRMARQLAELGKG